MEKLIKYAFRIIHIDNMSHVFKYGIVKKDSPYRSEHFVNIGDSQIIDMRQKNDMNGYHLGDYIPFYFGPRSPMLYVIQNGYNGVKRVAPENIVYCVIKLDDLINSGIDCIFTDGHALSQLTKYYEKEDLKRINDIVDYTDVYAAYWNSDTDIDLKRRKEAELLVESDLPSHLICGYVVYNEHAKKALMDIGISEDKIKVSRGYYF